MVNICESVKLCIISWNNVRLFNTCFQILSFHTDEVEVVMIFATHVLMTSSFSQYASASLFGLGDADIRTILFFNASCQLFLEAPFLFLDLVAVVPWRYVATNSPASRAPEYFRPTTLRRLTYLSLFKLLRVFQSPRIVSRLSKHVNISYRTQTILSYSAIFLTTIHASASASDDGKSTREPERAQKKRRKNRPRRRR